MLFQLPWQDNFNRLCASGAVPQTILFIKWSFPPNLKNIIAPKPWELESWHFEIIFTPHHVSHVRCPVSRVRLKCWFFLQQKSLSVFEGMCVCVLIGHLWTLLNYFLAKCFIFFCNIHKKSISANYCFELFWFPTDFYALHGTSIYTI